MEIIIEGIIGRKIQLKEVEDKYDEINEAIEAVEEYEKQHNITDRNIWTKYPVFEWNLTRDSGVTYSSVFPLSGYNFSGRIITKKTFYYIDMSMEFVNLNQSSTPNTDYTLSEVLYVISKSKPYSITTDNDTIISSCEFNQVTLKNNTIHFNYTYWIRYRDDKIKYSIKLFLEKAEISSLTFSHNGILLWKINQNQNLKSIKSERHSPYFYSHLNGYQMRLKLFQIQNNFHFRMYIVCGENDDSLPSTFSFKTTFTIFNLKNILENIISTKSYHNGVDASPIPLQSFLFSDLSNYISSNNTILVKLEVELLNVEEE
ncbi:hypothetical protein CHUAL_011699 [Chamberlinius hualienensis]